MRLVDDVFELSQVRQVIIESTKEPIGHFCDLLRSRGAAGAGVQLHASVFPWNPKK